jgi:hypothetical protein
MTLRADLEGLAMRWGQLAHEVPHEERTAAARATLRMCARELAALLARHDAVDEKEKSP